MFDAKDLLGRLAQSKMTQSSTDRLSHAMGGGQGPGAGGLADILGGLLGGQGGGGLGGALGGGAGPGGGGLGGLGDLLSQLGGRGGNLGGTGGMSGAGGLGGGSLGGGSLGGAGGLGGMLEGMLGGATRSVQSGNPLAMGGLAALVGAMLGGGGGAMKGAVGGGLLAVLGSLAFSALQGRSAAGGAPPVSLDQATPDQVPLGLREPQTLSEEKELQSTALLVIRAMVNAAKADGAIDGGEMSRIMGKLNELSTDAEACDFMKSELQKPFDLDALAKDVTSPEVAVQVYGASLLAIEVDTPAEEDYLKRLAERLGLDAEVVARVHEGLGVKPAA